MRSKYRITKVAKALIIQLIICSIGIICGFTWQVYDENARWDKLFYPGVKIANIDLGGKTREDGKKQLQSELIERLNDYKLEIKVKDYVFVLDCSKIIKGFEIDSIIDNAFSIGKDENFRSKYHTIKEGIEDDFYLYIDYDKSFIKEFITDIENMVYKEPINARIEIGGGTFRIIEDVKGLKLDGDKLEEQIKETISKNCFESMEIIAATNEITADITSEMLSEINAKIASSNTDFTKSLGERENNINLAAQAINQTILMPGDVFSFNKTVGESTIERGFKTAPVLSGVDFKYGVGGGICQVSSTLYNTVLKSGLKASERKNHSRPVSYVELGLDATVYWDTIDFKFENTLEYPIYIESYTEDNELYINFYSNSLYMNKEYIIKSDIYEKTMPKLIVINDESLEPGESVVVQSGSAGYWVMVTRNRYENSELQESEIISDDYYEPIDRIIRKGMDN